MFTRDSVRCGHERLCTQVRFPRTLRQSERKREGGADEKPTRIVSRRLWSSIDNVTDPSPSRHCSSMAFSQPLAPPADWRVNVVTPPLSTDGDGYLRPNKRNRRRRPPKTLPLSAVSFI